MDSLRDGIWMRGYGQRDPEVEYRREAFELFEGMVSRIKEDSLEFLLKFQPIARERVHSVFGSVPMDFLHPESEHFASQKPAGQERPVSPEELLSPGPPTRAPSPKSPEPFQRKGPKVGRNDPCPCGSGKKYKKCHG